MRFFLILLTVVTCTLTAVPDASAQTRVGGAMARFNDPFPKLLRESIIKEAADMSGVMLDVKDAKNDKVTQLSQIQEFVEQGVDAVVMNPAVGMTAEDLLALGDMLTPKNIPLVFLNTAPKVDTFPVPFAIVISNDLVAGRLQMRKAADLKGGKAKVFILKGLENHNAAIGRTRGVKQVADSYPGVSILGEATANWSRDEASALIAKWLQDGNSADVILANNDEMALGVIRGYQTAGQSLDDVVIGGVDATNDGLAAVADGLMTFTVKQNAEAQGRKAIQDAVKLVNGDVVPQYDWVPYELITEKNLASYQ